MYELRREQFIPQPLEPVFDFFADAANLEVITPPWLNFRILTPPPIAMNPGTLIDYRISWKGLPLRWRTRIEEWEPGKRFVDTQVRGPYALWHHTHIFVPQPGGVHMTDIVKYALHLGPLGRLAHAMMVRRDVNAIFDYRFSIIEKLLGRATA